MANKLVDYAKAAALIGVSFAGIGIGSYYLFNPTSPLNPSTPKVQRLEKKLTQKPKPTITSPTSSKPNTLEKEVSTTPNLRQPPFDLDSLRVGAYTKDNPIYVFTDGNEPDSTDLPYLLLGRNSLTIGSSPDSFSPSVQILPGNKYIDISDEEFLVLQTIGGKQGGKLTLERRDSEGKIPRITSRGEGYNIYSGEWGVRYNEEIGKTRKGPIMNENPYKTRARKSFPVQVVTLNKAGNRLQDWDIVIDSDGRVQEGNPNELEQEYSLRNGKLTSLRLAYQRLSKQEKEDLRNNILGKIVPIINPETIPTPEPASKPVPITNNWEFNPHPRDNTNVHDSYIAPKKPVPRSPIFLKSKTKASYNGEVYKRVPNTNKYIAPSGKFFLVD
ncbi:hypothetical protein J4218_04655 [Candidatus Pacearchaeota archaeon]|nr:hypothetical protein [Candidatus Pacearchaeota archaeon]